MLITFLFVVPAHLSTVLFAVAAADPHVIARKLRFALRLSYLIGLPAVAGICLCAHWVLSLYGPGYALIATVPMILLTITYVAYVPRALYLAVCRATGKMTKAAVVDDVLNPADSRGDRRRQGRRTAGYVDRALLRGLRRDGGDRSRCHPQRQWQRPPSAGQATDCRAGRTGGSVILPGISGSGSSLSPGPVFLLTCVRPSRGRALVRERGSGVVAR